MGTVWKPMVIVTALLGLLTYLLLQSRSPEPDRWARMHATLHAFELHDAELNRDVLLTRAGLLTHYDSLAQSFDGLYQALTALQSWREAASGDAMEALDRQLADLATAVQQKETLLEYFWL